MTSERSEAYGRAMKALADLGPSKFHPFQQEVIRDAADGLLFCEDLAEDSVANDALERFYALAAHLIENDVLTPDTVERLVADVVGCGPAPAGLAVPVA
jgi:hypothetical protein